MGTQVHSFITDSEEEATLLIAVIDNWIDGLPAAEEATIQDSTIDTAEKLLELVGDYAEQKRLLLRFRERLVRDLERHRYGTD